MTEGRFGFSQPGGTQNLTWREGPTPAPGRGEVTIAHRAIGVNFIDVYHLRGDYPLPTPSGLGVEAAGVVTALGAGVEGLAVGDRVVRIGGAPSAYASSANVAAGRVVRLPDDISFEAAATSAFKGVTAEYLIRRCHKVAAGETVLLYAASGGVGTIMLKWMVQLGARVIGVTGSAAKAAAIAAHGGAPLVATDYAGLAAQARQIAPSGVDVVYDSIGGPSFAASLDSLRPRGLMVSFGIAGGPLPADAMDQFGRRQGLFFTKPSIAFYTASRAELVDSADAVFQAIRDGVAPSAPDHVWPLSEAPRALDDLAARKTSGAQILVPDA